jgi:AcrR family transcriptional regulator
MKNTKDIILQTAYDMFLHNTYEAVTINSIIKATGMTKGAIYHYYASKEELFIAVVDRYMLENKISIEIEHSSLRDLINYTINKTKEHTSTMTHEGQKDMPIQHVSLILAAVRYYPGYVEIGNKFFWAEVNKWEKVMERAIVNREIREGIDTKSMSMNFLSIGTNIVALALLSGSMEYAMEMYQKQMEELYKSISV